MFTVLIDESGDTGLDGVRPEPSWGPTQYFAMCATIFRDSRRDELLQAIEKLPIGMKKYHSKRLHHFEKVYTCREVAKLRIAIVGVISNKLTLGSYLSEARRTNTHFYNKVMQYLLERIGVCLATYRILAEDVRIILEAREQQYSSLISFVEAIQKRPIDFQASFLRRIDAFSIGRAKKADDPLFCLPDLGSHAMLSALRRTEAQFSVTEPRYLKELAPCFLADKVGRIFPRGIKPIHNIGDLEADPETAQVFRTLSNRRPVFRRLEW